MILIDAIYINNSGGLVLLQYLIKELEKSKLDVFYLLDDRTEQLFSNLNEDRCKFMSSLFYNRVVFYTKNKRNFTSVLCFGNIPPPIKLDVPVSVYFHQPLFLSIPPSFSLRNKIVYRLKQNILGFYKKNTSFWIVQSNLIKCRLAKKYLSEDDSRVKVIPFYPPLEFIKDDIHIRKDKNFLYVSNSAPHKNHDLLLDAFCDAYDINKKGLLTVTVPTSSYMLCDKIKQKIADGYPIVNVGFVDRNELIELYLSHQYLIFPSLAESFGLGLVEAIDGGCKVIVSDLPYAYQVCKPSLTFDPNIKESIKNAIVEATEKDLPESEKIISNDINQLISLLSD